MIKGGFCLKGGVCLTNLFILNCLSAFSRLLRDAILWYGSGFMPSVRPMSGSAVFDDRTGSDVHGGVHLYLHPGRLYHQGRDEAGSMAPAQAIFR